MAFTTAHLRRWFALAAALLCFIVAGVYFHARRNVQNALKQVPEKLNLQIQQSAEGFTISKSEQGRTLFKLQASKAVQFKISGRAELHDVMITIYGTDSSRFDQIYGKSFEYDQHTGNVSSQGEVSIDLQSNPGGVSNPDQATPRELKNPVHLKTTNLVFNQKTGDAWTASRVEFYVPQLSGSAMGAAYNSKDNVLTLNSQVHMLVSGTHPLTILARRAILEKNPREILLQQPQTDSPQGRGQADDARLFLRNDNTLDHAVATGNVAIDSALHGHPRLSSSTLHVTSGELQVAMGLRNEPERAVFSRDVRFRNEGSQTSEGSAGRVELLFSARSALKNVHATEDVKLFQRSQSAASSAQDLEVTAPNIDFFLSSGNRMSAAETAGPPQIRFLPAAGRTGPETRVTADKFTAKFDSLGQLSQVHGEAHARVVSSSPNGPTAAPDRVSTSDSIDAHFLLGSTVESLLQQGHFTYFSGTQRAFGKSARYTPSDQLLAISGSPGFIDSGMETTAVAMLFNRATGEARALGNVKTTYSDLKPQPDGALLASSDPIHVTAATMTARSNPQIATYTGNARLWQDANVIEAPSIRFSKDQRNILADSTSKQKVSTTLISADKAGKTMPVNVTSDHLTYEDAKRQAHYEGSVVAQGADMTLTCKQMDVFFARSANAAQSTGVQTSSQAETGAPATGTGSPQAQAKLEKIVANGTVVMTQPNRRAQGDMLTYTASDDKFVLTGGPPSIFDAEHGKITGVSLTLYRTDDRVIVDGNSSSPAVTETRVER